MFSYWRRKLCYFYLYYLFTLFFQFIIIFECSWILQKMIINWKYILCRRVLHENRFKSNLGFKEWFNRFLTHGSAVVLFFLIADQALLVLTFFFLQNFVRHCYGLITQISLTIYLATASLLCSSSFVQTHFFQHNLNTNFVKLSPSHELDESLVEGETILWSCISVSLIWPKHYCCVPWLHLKAILKELMQYFVLTVSPFGGKSKFSLGN